MDTPHGRATEAPTDTESAAELLPFAARLARVGGWAIDLVSDQVEWSDEINLILDYPLGEVPDLTEAIDLHPEPDRTQLNQALDACRSAGRPFDLELWMHTATGRELRVRAVGEARRDEHGEIVRLQGAFQDITESYRLEQEARSLAQRLETTLESMSDALFIVDRDWIFTYLNRRSEELLLRSRDELLGRNLWVEFAPAVGSEFYVAYHRAVETGETEALVAYYEPLATWFDVTAYPTPEGLVVHFRDVNELVRASRELERRQAMLDRVSDAILVRSVDDRITHWYGGAERMYGWSSDEVIGRSVRELLYDDPAEYEMATCRTIADGAWNREVVHRRRDGSRFTVAMRLSLIRDEDGSPESVVAINTDITERRRIEAELYRAQRLDAVGRLAGGIAHDLNNALAPIVMAADLLANKVVDRDQHELVESIRQSAERGSDTVRRVLTFASGIDAPKVLVDVDGLVDDIAGIVTSTFPRSISLVVERDLAGATVRGDRTQLHQVLLNLCVNARDALTAGGVLTIRTRGEEIDEQYAGLVGDIVPGSYVAIVIGDTGTGMRADVLDRALEPFFTTKAPGEGTGLGLSISRSIVQSHDGLLRLQSTHGEGTVAEVVVPLVDGSASELRRAEPALARGRGETVLVVDDEPAVLHVTRRTLEQLGYRVVTAPNGADAVMAFAADTSIAVVVTDMAMPIMDGSTTVRVLRTIRPEVPIVVVTGFATDRPDDAVVRGQADAFLPKPFTAAQLAQTVALVLGRSSRQSSLTVVKYPADHPRTT